MTRNRPSSDLKPVAGGTGGRTLGGGAVPVGNDGDVWMTEAGVAHWANPHFVTKTKLDQEVDRINTGHTDWINHLKADYAKAIKAAVDPLTTGMLHSEPVLTVASKPPAAIEGDRVIVTGNLSGDFVGHQNHIATLGPLGAWTFTPPVSGETRFAENLNETWHFNGASWVKVTNAGGGASSIDDLNDVDTTTTAPSNGDILQWDNGNWVPKTPAAAPASVITYKYVEAPAGDAYKIPAVDVAATEWVEIDFSMIVTTASGPCAPSLNITRPDGTSFRFLSYVSQASLFGQLLSSSATSVNFVWNKSQLNQWCADDKIMFGAGNSDPANMSGSHGYGTGKIRIEKCAFLHTGARHVGTSIVADVMFDNRSGFTSTSKHHSLSLHTIDQFGSLYVYANGQVVHGSAHYRWK